MQIPFYFRLMALNYHYFSNNGSKFSELLLLLLFQVNGSELSLFQVNGSELSLFQVNGSELSLFQVNGSELPLFQ
jgi:hypothetical protein